MYEILWYFIIYSFLGWCMEVAFATFKSKTFINRGFLNGPVCPIYGVGAVVVLIILKPFSDNGFLIFLLSAIITTVIEFLTGFFLELIFKNKWWDYSKRRFNIKGYVCLEFSVIWGLACLFVYDVIHRGISYTIDNVSNNIGLPILILFLVIFSVDIFISVIQILKFNKNLSYLNKIAQGIRGQSDKIGERISSASLELSNLYDELVIKKNSYKERIIKAFPNISSVKYPAILKDIKERIKKNSKRK